ncbi:MAG: hypothetical protein WCX78_01780 [Patescibacteria group bacterium]
MPDGTWKTIPLGATGEKVRSVQADFWLAWGDYHRYRRLAIKSQSTKPCSPAKK